MTIDRIKYTKEFSYHGMSEKIVLVITEFY